MIGTDLLVEGAGSGVELADQAGEEATAREDAPLDVGHERLAEAPSCPSPSGADRPGAMTSRTKTCRAASMVSSWSRCLA